MAATKAELQHIDDAAESYCDAAIAAVRAAKRCPDILDAQHHLRRAERHTANAITAYEVEAFA